MIDRTYPNEWTAFHVFLHDGQKCEQWLTSQLFPLVERMLQEQQVSSWFFLRYWEGGPHIRVRFESLAPESVEQLRSTLQSSTAGFGADAPLTRSQYYSNHSFDGATVEEQSLPWFEDREVARIEYVPEWQRYGGPHAMACNETLFSVSSQLAASLIASTPGDMATRVSKAAIVTAATIRAVGLGIEEAKDFAAGYFQMWGSYSPDNQAIAARRLQSAPEPEALSKRADKLFASADGVSTKGGALYVWSQAVVAWVETLRDLAAQGKLINPSTGRTVTTVEETSQAIGQILFSQIHMTNNRLSVTPDLEMRIADFLAGERLSTNHQANPELETV